MNLFIWPAGGAAVPTGRMPSRQGYNLIWWNRDSMTFCAVSDVSADDLDEFARLLRSGP